MTATPLAPGTAASARPARVSVTMVTRDRRDTTLATLGRLLALPEQPPITVVDNGSHDGKVDAIRAAWPTVDVVALTSNLGAAARTIGVQRSRSPYVAFSDDDSWWAPGALALAADTLDAYPRLGLLATRVLVEHPSTVDLHMALDAECRSVAHGGAGLDGHNSPEQLGFRLACIR